MNVARFGSGQGWKLSTATLLILKTELRFTEDRSTEAMLSGVILI